MSKKQISRENLDDLIIRARDMRNHPTPAEAILWKELRAKKLLGLKFRRQHIIPPYIVDFCCLSKKLIIEVDGTAHDTRKMYDRKRDEILQQRGFKILRFTNKAILENQESVIQKITSYCVNN